MFSSLGSKNPYCTITITVDEFYYDISKTLRKMLGELSDEKVEDIVHSLDTDIGCLSEDNDIWWRKNSLVTQGTFLYQQIKQEIRKKFGEE